jgi:tetratricopeptide (TPR) repeat protein
LGPSTRVTTYHLAGPQPPLRRMNDDRNHDDEPIGWYEDAVLANPADTLSLCKLGAAYSMLGRYSDAINVLNKAIEVSPTYAMAYHSLGLAYFSAGEIEEGIKILSRGVELDPKNGKANFNLGAAFQRIGDNERAVKFLDRATRLGHGNDRAYTCLGIAYGALGRFEEAVKAFRHSITLHPDAPLVHYSLGKIIAGPLSQPQEAIPYLQRCIELAPAYVAARHDLVICYIALDLRELAANEIDVLRTYDPESADSLLTMALEQRPPV